MHCDCGYVLFDPRPPSVLLTLGWLALVRKCSPCCPVSVSCWLREDTKACSLSIYWMALRRISTLGSLWFGFIKVLLFRASKASFTFFRRLFSLNVAALRRSMVTVFLLHSLQAQGRHWPGQCGSKWGDRLEGEALSSVPVIPTPTPPDRLPHKLIMEFLSW